MTACFLSLLTALCLSSFSWACDVPVFRYALERWPSDHFQLLVVEVTSLTSKEKAAIAALNKVSMAGNENLNLRIIEMSRQELEKGPYAGKISEGGVGDTNRFTLIYPSSSGNNQPLWSGPITGESAKKLISSPIREQLIKGILSGSTGIFILLESGNKEKDAKTLALLKATTAKLNKTLKLPGEVVGVDENRMPVDPTNKLESKIPFKVEFQVLSLPRTGDEVLMHCLLGLEPDLAGIKDEPMVFSVYGRGRALTPLIYGGINAEVLEGIAAYFCGICSCQVKAQNPGTDLLLLQDWDLALFGKDKK